MSYYNEQETKNRIARVKGILKDKDLDAALIYYDELNIANGWYCLLYTSDISLIGFDVHDKTGLVVPGITTVRQPESLIGTKTGELLIKRLKQKGNKKSRQTAKCRKILLDRCV